MNTFVVNFVKLTIVKQSPEVLRCLMVRYKHIYMYIHSMSPETTKECQGKVQAESKQHNLGHVALIGSIECF